MDSTCIVSRDRQLSSCAKSSGKLLLLRICPNNSRPSMLDQSQKMGFVSRQIIENLVFSTYNLTIPGANPNWSNDILLHLWETKLATEIGANFNYIKRCSNTCLVFDLNLFKDHYRVCPYRIRPWKTRWNTVKLHSLRSCTWITHDLLEIFEAHLFLVV